jgi:hypothetical protein
MPTSTRASRLTRAAEAMFRQDFVRILAQVGLGPDEAAALVEASRGRPFDTCRPADLLPVIDELLAAVQRATHADGGSTCEE